jgi:hypothetical protein
MLCLEITGFAAIDAIVLSVLTEADVVRAHTESAEAVTFALLLGLLTCITTIWFGHA